MGGLILDLPFFLLADWYLFESKLLPRFLRLALRPDAEVEEISRPDRFNLLMAPTLLPPCPYALIELPLLLEECILYGAYSLFLPFLDWELARL